MKKLFIYCFLSIICCHLIPISALAQKGNMVFGLGGGFGIYRTHFLDKSDSSNTTSKDTSGAFVFPLTFEYRVFNFLRMGVRISLSNYLRDSTAKKDGDKASGFDAMACVNVHFLRASNMELFLSGEIGRAHV